MQDVGQTFGTSSNASASNASGPSAAEIISGVASGFGVLTQLQQSRVRAKSLLGQSAEAEQNARIEGVNADVTKNLIRRRLNETLANNSAALSASGVDPTSGSARVVQEQSRSAANKAFFDTDLNARIRVAALKRQAKELRQAAREERKAGKRNAVLGLVKTGFQIAGMGAA